MKIFFLPTSYPNEKQPQKDIFIYEQAKQLAKMGHKIFILHIEKLPTKQLFGTVKKEVMKIDDGFAIRYTNQQKTFLEEKFPSLSRDEFIKNAEKLFNYAVKENGRPDVIYAHFSQWAGYAGSIISEKYSIPLVTIEHFSGLVNGNLSASLEKCVRTTIEKSKYFICVSEKLKKAVLEKVHPHKEIYVVPNMIDDSFHYQPPRPHEGFIFSAIGRLTTPKNYNILIAAFIQAFSADDNVYLRIGGDGEERHRLENLVQKAGRQHQIRFLGSLTREQTMREYINCDCFALSSAWETYGIVYREALAIGRPIVTTDHGGFSEKEWHLEYGYKVPIKNVSAFANALKQIVKNYNQFDGKLISEICLNDCAADIVGAKIEFFLTSAKGVNYE